MAVQFRCQACGVTLRADALPAGPVACPECKATVTVNPTEAGPAKPLPVDTGDDSSLTVLAEAVPWAVSVVFHIAAFLVMLFVVLTYRPTTDLDRVIIPDARLTRKPGGAITEAPKREVDRTSRSLRQARMHAYTKARSKDLLSEVSKGKKSDLRIVGIGAPGGGAKFGLKIGGGGAGPNANFLGSGGNAYKIVYVIDRSGSMIECFDFVKRELKRSLEALQPSQSFHLIFSGGAEPEVNSHRNVDEEEEVPFAQIVFASWNPRVKSPRTVPVVDPRRKLVHATQHFKKKAFAFIDTLVAEGGTDPVPALDAAFKVAGGPPELIYLMTDGNFDAAAAEAISKWNKERNVKINTIAVLYQFDKELLEKIAKESGGRYKFVSTEELGG